MIATIIVNFVYGIAALMGLTPFVWYARNSKRRTMGVRLLAAGLLSAAVLMGILVGLGWLLRWAMGVEPNAFHEGMKWAVLVYFLAAIGLTVVASIWGGTDFDSNAPPNPTYNQKPAAAEAESDDGPTTAG